MRGIRVNINVIELLKLQFLKVDIFYKKKFKYENF